MASKSVQLALECQRESESCLYTSTSLFIWLRFLRTLKWLFIILPLILGTLAGWQVLKMSHIPHITGITSAAALLAGLLPTIYAALKLDHQLDECCRLAGEFKNLQDRFRQAALVSSHKSFTDFEQDVKPLMNRLERARSVSYTAPEWCFKRAQEKIKKGDYNFDVDAAGIDAGSAMQAAPN